jgi:hypothetical protein
VRLSPQTGVVTPEALERPVVEVCKSKKAVGHLSSCHGVKLLPAIETLASFVQGICLFLRVKGISQLVDRPWINFFTRRAAHVPKSILAVA